MIVERAILKINPNAKMSIINDDINRITWLDGTTPISKADIQAQLSAAELDIALDELRAKRNKDLQDSDWTQLPDNTLTSAQRNSWMLFRTELRNITNGLTSVDQVKNVDYPDKPNG